MQEFEKKFTFQIELFTHYNYNPNFKKTNYNLSKCEQNFPNQMTHDLRGNKTEY